MRHDPTPAPTASPARWRLRLLLLGAATLAVAACGRKGDLEQLPPEEEPAPAEPSPPPPAEPAG